MNITIAVALITACSTLAGGVIASITTLAAQGKQLRHQATLTAAERRSQHYSRQREIRRSAYADLLGKMHEAERRIAACWKELHLTENNFTAAWAVVHSINAPVDVVSMEGPLVMVAQALVVRLVFHEELIRVHSIFEQNKNSTGPLIEGRDDEYEDSFGRREKAKYDFTEAAREVLAEMSEEYETSLPSHLGTHLSHADASRP